MAYFYSIDKYIAKTIAAVDKIKRIRRITPFMFEYVEDKEYLSRVRRVCGGIMQDFCHSLKVEYDIGASFYLVGSGARNLIVQNALNPIDLDYNLEIIRCDDFNDCRTIKGTDDSQTA